MDEEEQPQEEFQDEEDDSWRPVDSTMVSEWAYEEGELQVRFVNGHEASYPIDPTQWAEARETASPGRWMHEHVL